MASAKHAGMSRTCDVAVIGLGVMGSAALAALARRGVDAVGFDPLRVGEPRGSSHGSCRIFRRFNFESPAYTALSDQAYAGWRELERACGEALLLPCPILEAGPPGSALVQASYAASLAAGAPGERMTGAEANARFAAFRLPAGWDAVVQAEGGILSAERALRALRNQAGGRIVQQTARLEGGAVVTADGERWEAGSVILAAGPWIADLSPALAPRLKITRQAVGWFAPARPETTAQGAFPVFIVEGPLGAVYGFPDFEGRGVKAALHELGPQVGADQWGPAPSDAELEPVGRTLAELVPGAAGPVREREVCLYTSTPDDEFVIDRLPGEPRIIVASPCSGHGFKFAPAIGEMLAEMATDPGARADPAFRLDRFGPG